MKKKKKKKKITFGRSQMWKKSQVEKVKTLNKKRVFLKKGFLKAS